MVKKHCTPRTTTGRHILSFPVLWDLRNQASRDKINGQTRSFLYLSIWYKKWYFKVSISISLIMIEPGYLFLLLRTIYISFFVNFVFIAIVHSYIQKIWKSFSHWILGASFTWMIYELWILPPVCWLLTLLIAFGHLLADLKLEAGILTEGNILWLLP